MTNKIENLEFAFKIIERVYDIAYKEKNSTVKQYYVLKTLRSNPLLHNLNPQKTKIKKEIVKN